MKTCCGNFRPRGSAAGAPGGQLPPTEPNEPLVFNGLLWVPGLPLPTTVIGTNLLTSTGNQAEFLPFRDRSLHYRFSSGQIGPASNWLGHWTIGTSFASAALAGPMRVMKTGILHTFRLYNGRVTVEDDPATYVLVHNGADAHSMVLHTNSLGPASDLSAEIPVVVGDILHVRVDNLTGNRTLHTVFEFFGEY